jgi:von Willebrand factor type A domain
MNISLLTPLAGLLALGALVPLAVFVGRERRAAHIRRILNLAPSSPKARAPVAAALISIPVLLGIAATQPVLERSRALSERSDAEAFFVLDTSRSMLASSSAGSPTRFQRAAAAARELQLGLPEIPIGLASITSRVLPHLLPTTDTRVLDATLQDSIGVDRPPAATFSELATALGALTDIPHGNYFSPHADKRLLIVFTDGETQKVTPALAKPFARRPRIQTIFVRLWAAYERIYETGAAESGYTPLPASGPRLEQARALLDGHTFDESELAQVRAAATRYLGTGATRERELEGQRLALMPYLTLAAFAPLGLLLWRRNL